MKLSKEQIAQIDETLVLNKVDYDDIKLELTDHIASDIEDTIDSLEVSFEIAFKEVFEKWKEQFRPSENWFWGDDKTPKIVIDKTVKNKKKQVLFMLILSISITLLVIKMIKFYDNNIVTNVIGKLYNILFMTVAILLLIGRKVIEKSKNETSYGHMYKKYFFFLLLILFIMRPFSLFKYFIPDSYLDILYLWITTLVLVYPISFLHLLYKHFQFERKLSKV